MRSLLASGPARVAPEEERVDWRPPGWPSPSEARADGRDPEAEPARERAPRAGRELVRLAAHAAGLWAATRVGLLVLTYFAAPQEVRGNRLTQSWLRWDATWYLEIARHGHTAQSSHFFPLYPFLTRLAIHVVGDAHAALAMLLIANVAALVAFVALALLAFGEFGSQGSAIAAVRAAAAYPLAFMTFAPLTEGLFVALVTLALLAARRGSWWLAAGTAFLAALPRPNGLILLAPMACELGRHLGWWRALRDRARPRLPRPLDVARVTAVLAAGPLGLGLYMWHVGQRFGDPLVWVRTVSEWGHADLPPWRSVPLFLHNFPPPDALMGQYMLTDGVPLLVFGVLTAVSVGRVPFSFTLFMAGLLYTTIASPVVVYADTFLSAGRYLTAAAPVFLLLGRWMERRPALDLLVVAGGFLLQGLFVSRFLAFAWVS